jgi:hypothetical protein
MVSQIMGTGETPVEPPVAAAEVPAEIANDPGSSGDPKPDLPEQPLRLSAQSAPLEQNSSRSGEEPSLETEQKVDSNGPDETPDSVAPQHEVRRHGSAKPVV